MADAYDASPGQREQLVDARILQMLRDAPTSKRRRSPTSRVPRWSTSELRAGPDGRADWVSDNLAVLNAAFREAPAAPTG